MRGINFNVGDATNPGLINDCPCLLKGKAVCAGSAGLCYHFTGNSERDFCKPCGNWGILAHAKVIDDKAPHKCQPACPGDITRRRLELLSKAVKLYFDGAPALKLGSVLAQARELEPVIPPRRKKGKSNADYVNRLEEGFNRAFGGRER